MSQRRPPSRRARLLAVAAAGVAAVGLLAVGCGGDDDGGSSGASTAAAENSRLTPAQWTEYRTAGESFVQARDEAQKKLETCPRSTTGNLDVLETCLSPSLDALSQAATDLGGVLTGFIGTVSGSCATALNDFTQYVTPFVASITQLQSTLASDNVAGLANSRSSVQTALSGGMQEREAFERECAPL